MINLLKDWVISWDFVVDEINYAFDEGSKYERPKIFAAAQKDILETMRDDIDARAEELAKKKLEQLISIVDERMIISFNDRERRVYIGGEAITDPGVLHNLKSEAEMLMASEIWKLIQETPKRLAERAMFVDDGKLENQLLKGRSILYTLDTQKRILDHLKSYAQTT